MRQLPQGPTSVRAEPAIDDTQPIEEARSASRPDEVAVPRELLTSFLSFALGAEARTDQELVTLLETGAALLAAEQTYPSRPVARIDFRQCERTGRQGRLEIGQAIHSEEEFERLVIMEVPVAEGEARFAHLQITYTTDEPSWLVAALQEATAARDGQRLLARTAQRIRPTGEGTPPAPQALVSEGP